MVGVDGSSGGQHALAWAVAKRHRFGPVEPILAFRAPFKPAKPGEADSGTAVLRAAAETRLRALVEELDVAPTIDPRVVEGSPGPALCTAAQNAAMLVVGSQSRSAAADTVVGSVAAYCARHSPVPVAIVPPHFPVGRPILRAVVGVDGSKQADAALRWAIDHVEPDGVVVAVGALPTWGFTEAGMDPSRARIETMLRDRVEESVERVTAGSTGGPSVQIHTTCLDARPALRDLAGSLTDLLVVGDRGLGTIRFLLLGSVSSALVHHPRVPTVVVRQPAD